MSSNLNMVGILYPQGLHLWGEAALGWKCLGEQHLHGLCADARFLVAIPQMEPRDSAYIEIWHWEF